MTDHTTPSDDELSLALDGEADAELLARIEATPEAQARLEELRAAAVLVGTTVPPLDDDTVDELIAAAIDTPVAPSRGASTGRRGPTPWLVAAAVILLMAVGLSLVWAGRSTDDDQASASRTSLASSAEEKSASSDAAFSESGGALDSASGGAGTAGGHGSATTIASPSSASSLPTVYLGSYETAADLRKATATSFADALAASGAPLTFDDTDPQATTGKAMSKTPASAAVDRCAQQLQVTLSLKTNPVQTGYATVGDQDVLVYEFATTSARDGKDTTVVAAVGTDACDEVVIFER